MTQPYSDLHAAATTGDPLREQLAEAWDDGFSEGGAAERGQEYLPNPYRTRRCEFPGCQLAATAMRRVCPEHFRSLTDLLAPVQP